jgi:hypothetical protein
VTLGGKTVGRRPERPTMLCSYHDLLYIVYDLNRKTPGSAET